MKLIESKWMLLETNSERTNGQESRVFLYSSRVRLLAGGGGGGRGPSKLVRGVS